jgi:hypothetical protein
VQEPDHAADETKGCLMTPINPRQKSLLNSLALINVKQFIELERVKKPSA